MKADNKSFTMEHREWLKKEINKIFIEPSHQEHITSMVEVSNPENIKDTFHGFQSIPKPDLVSGGFKVRMWNNKGTWHTPRFGKKYDKNQYEDDKSYTAILDFPEDISDHIGPGSLVIQLEVETREEEGWQEEVVFQKGTKYKFHKEERTWVDAEAYCQAEGGHLASVQSDEEWQEVFALTSGEKWIWLGGNAEEEKGVWRWTDESAWHFSNWDDDKYAAGGKGCTLMARSADYRWQDFPCTHISPFLCQSPAVAVRGNTSLEFSSLDLTFSYFRVSYSYKVNQGLLVLWENRRMNGFRLSWRIKSQELKITTNEIGKSIQTPGFREIIGDESFHKTDRNYQATLVFPDNIQVGNGSLVIQLEVDIREEEGWQGEASYPRQGKWGPEKYIKIKSAKYWKDAEAYCQGQGGHLASILSDEEQKEVTAAAGNTHVWIGANDLEQKGVMRWSNGLPFNFTNWMYARRKGGCAMAYKGGRWMDDVCQKSFHFICQSTGIRVLRRNTIDTIKLTKEELELSSQWNSFTVSYSYRFNQELVRTREGCPHGFTISRGDVPGWGSISGEHQDKNTTECKEMCNNTPGCCSFEWSPTSRLCNLNKECLPASSQYRDYLFCQKGKVNCKA